MIPLLSHAISHEKRLVRFPAEHSIYTLRRGLRLGATEVGLPVHLHEVVVTEWIRRHRMLIYLVIFEARHHIVDPGLSRRLGPLLVDLAGAAHVHLFEVLLGGWVDSTREVVGSRQLLGL